MEQSWIHHTSAIHHGAMIPVQLCHGLSRIHQDSISAAAFRVTLINLMPYKQQLRASGFVQGFGCSIDHESKIKRSLAVWLFASRTLLHLKRFFRKFGEACGLVMLSTPLFVSDEGIVETPLHARIAPALHSCHQYDCGSNKAGAPAIDGINMGRVRLNEACSIAAR